MENPLRSMAKYSLIPERQLLFSPELAQTIGLEEAILVQHLRNLLDYSTPKTLRGYSWLNINQDSLIKNLPFWSRKDLSRIIENLVEKGVILIDKKSNFAAKEIIFAFNESTSEASFNTEFNEQNPSLGAPLSASWLPSKNILSLLKLNHNIPEQFAKDQIEDFTLYWRERGKPSHAWENKFRQHVLSRWRKYQSGQFPYTSNNESNALNQDWRPSDDALDILTKAGIASAFIEDALPEFILYWRENEATVKGLSSKFIQHVRLQWSRYQNSLAQESESKRISENWKPSGDLFDILKLAHIDASFAISVLPEFILYWREDGGMYKSWNSKFLQHVKYHWAKRHQLEQKGYEKEQTADSNRSTRDRSIEEDIRDTTWAE